jgi:(p)ppGpp synthase/HD superfamily hydrolase
MHLGLNFERALTYALHVHGGHVRKGTEVPYFSHLMAVSATVIENGGSEVQAIAALLHDAVEDQGGRPRLQDISDRFGSEVAEIVEACSDSLDGAADDKKEDWLVRKRQYLASLKNKRSAILEVTVADKLHNARAIFRDAQSKGPSWWRDTFRRPAEQTIAYYTAIHRVLNELHASPVTTELADAVRMMETKVADTAAHQRFVAELMDWSSVR